MSLSEEMRNELMIIKSEIELNNYEFDDKDYKGLCLGKLNVLESTVPKIIELEQENEKLKKDNKEMECCGNCGQWSRFESDCRLNSTSYIPTVGKEYCKWEMKE